MPRAREFAPAAMRHVDLDNFCFKIGEISFEMHNGELSTINMRSNVKTLHYDFEYSGAPLYLLARAYVQDEAFTITGPK